nr:hypothetical protein [Flavobacterium franklandianum]
MKAIHNTPEALKKEFLVGNYKLKYNFESNSQHRRLSGSGATSWEL